jgi:hypothetical protein
MKRGMIKITDTIDPLNYKEYRTFKKLYLQAVKEDKKEFTFKESIVLTAFAKYCVEYIENIRNARKLKIATFK